MRLVNSVRSVINQLLFIRRCNLLRDNFGGVSISNMDWFSAPHSELWAHAGGGRYHIYGNSKEAFDDAINSGFSIIEADVALTCDGVPVMSHRFRPNNEVSFDKVPSLKDFLSKRINESYTPMTLDDFIKRYENVNVYYAIDPSPDLRETRGADYIMRYLINHSSVTFQKKVIYQLSGVSNLTRFVDTGWKGAFHYSLDFDPSSSKEGWRLKYLIPAIKAIGVASVSYVDMPITSQLRDSIHLFKSAGLRVSVASVNSIARFLQLKAIGIDCIDTDFIYPSGQIN